MISDRVKSHLLFQKDVNIEGDKREIYEEWLMRSLSACGGFGMLNFADKSEIYAKFVLAKEVYHA